MTTRRWLDNAFWHDDGKQVAEAILIITDSEGREISQVVTVRKHDAKGNENADWVELMEQVGEEQIDASTAERRSRKEKEKQEGEQKRQAEASARELEQLFDAKIKVLEIDEIKNTKNRTLKGKLRRSKNMIEMQMYAQLILMEEHGIGFTTYESE